MKSHISLKDCPFCGGKIEMVKGPGNITFFRCNNMECLADISFGGNKTVSPGITEAENPIKNFNRRVNNGGKT
ncbi:MAG: Lar family restriction alleviation protein [Oscillospiraceae bacterium]|nr:Lar family restriction alleviation protein [Oscillospiraceae bacterium]